MFYFKVNNFLLKNHLKHYAAKFLTNQFITGCYLAGNQALEEKLKGEIETI